MINIDDRLSIDDVDRVVVNYFNILMQEYIEMVEKLKEESFLDIDVNTLSDFPEIANEKDYFVLKSDIKNNEKNYHKGDYFVWKSGEWKLVPSVMIIYSTSDFFVSRQVKGIHQRILPSLFLKRTGLSREFSNVGGRDTYFRTNKFSKLRPMLRSPSVHYNPPAEVENKNTLRINPPIMANFIFNCEFLSRRMVDAENFIWFLNIIDKRGWGNFIDDNGEDKGGVFVNVSDDYDTQPSNVEDEERYMITTFSLNVKYYITSNVTEKDEIKDVNLSID